MTFLGEIVLFFRMVVGKEYSYHHSFLNSTFEKGRMEDFKIKNGND